MPLDNHGDITVEALQSLFVQTLQDVVAKVRDRHLQCLSHNAKPSTTGSAGHIKVKVTTRLTGTQKGYKVQCVRHSMQEQRELGIG